MENPNLKWMTAGAPMTQETSHFEDAEKWGDVWATRKFENIILTGKSREFSEPMVEATENQPKMLIIQRISVYHFDNSLIQPEGVQNVEPMSWNVMNIYVYPSDESAIKMLNLCCSVNVTGP